MMDYPQSLMRYPHTNNSLLSSGNTKKSTTYEPRTEAISPAINDDIIQAEETASKSTKDEQTLLVEKLKRLEAEISQTDKQIIRLRRQKEQLEQAANSRNKDEDDQENVCDTRQLSIAKLVYHENRAKAQKSHAKLEYTGGVGRDLPVYNQPSDNSIYHQISAKYNQVFKPNLITCFKNRLENRLQLEETISKEYDRRMEKWLKSIEAEDSQTIKRIKDAKTREFFEKQFPELKKARESGERFSRVGQRVARSDAEVAELMDGIAEREDQDKKVKSYAVIPPMLEEMRSPKPKYINHNGYVEDIIAEYKEYQILNTWTDEEKEIFRENYLQHPKDFGLIARMTSRKNVANCVQYYYLSKKSENYKQLLKRQQKRRTRSFVRPAQATPAQTSALPDTESSKSNNSGNDRQAGDSVPADTIKSAEQSDGPKPDTSTDQAVDLEQASNTEPSADNCCCICSCQFSDTNLFRNVTRSNHQLYGISRELLRPGMKICYPCRFRHVKHPSLDEPYNSPEPMEDCQENSHVGVMMDVDKPVIEEQPRALSENQVNNNEINALSTRPNSPPKEQQSGPISSPNASDSNKGPKRTCVRDIIYQAIEMSFQKSKPTETMDVQMKTAPIRSEPIPAPTLPTVPQTNILPLKQIGPIVQPSLPPVRPPPPQVPMQSWYMDCNYRQQIHPQIYQQRPIPRHPSMPRDALLLAPQLPQPISSAQLPPPMMTRYPNQPLHPVSVPPAPIRHITSHPNHPLPPIPPSSLLTTTVPISSPLMVSAASHQPSQKPLPPAAMPPPTGATNHPLDFSRRYAAPAPVFTTGSGKANDLPPPLAHSGKASHPSRGASVDEGVLNLSAKIHSPSTTPVAIPIPTPSTTHVSTPVSQPILTPITSPTVTSIAAPILTTISQPQLTANKKLPEVAPISPHSIKAPSPKLEPITTPPPKSPPPTQAPSPKQEPVGSHPGSPTPPKEPSPKLDPPESPKAKSPAQTIKVEESGSPGFPNSPTSPKEMVIDESADVGSPSSASSPASEREEEKNK